MFSLTKLAVFLTVAISVAAMPSHLARQVHHHKEIAARVAQPEVAPVPEIAAREMTLPSKRVVRKKRARNGRCNNSSSISSSSSSNVPLASTPVESPQPLPTPEGDVRKNPGTTSSTPEPTPTPQEPQPATPTPEPTTTPASTSTTPAPSPTSGGGGQTYTGQGTFYTTGLGACGITNNDGQFIAAVSQSFFDTYPGYDGVNPNNNPLCGKIAQVIFQAKTIEVALTDRCTGCAYGDLDFSPSAFDQFASPSVGRIDGIQWQILN